MESELIQVCGSLLTEVNGSLNDAYWFISWDNNIDDSFLEKILALRLRTHLKYDDYVATLNNCQIGSGRCIANRWKKFLVLNGIKEFEFVQRLCFVWVDLCWELGQIPAFFLNHTVEKFTVAYSQAPNPGNVFLVWKFHEKRGAPVSSFIPWFVWL